jgi:acyl carrier protein
MITKEYIIDYIKDKIQDISLGAVQAKSISNDSRIIQQLGLDSMDYATIMLMTEQKLGIKIHEDGVRWGEIQTIEQLADLFFQTLHK